MYAAIAYVDKQSFPFSDVLRACFYEIANHAKINGAKDVSLIAGNIFCKTVQMHSVFSSACSYADVRCAFIKGRHNPWQNQKKYTSSRALVVYTYLNFYRAFRQDSLDVLTNASITAKIAACGMYMSILPQLTRNANPRVNPKQNRFTIMLTR